MQSVNKGNGVTEHKHNGPEDEVKLDDISLEDENSQEDTGDVKEVPSEAEELTSSRQHEGLKPPKESWYKRLFATKKRIIMASILAVLIVLGVLYAIPATRYGILGTVVKKNVTITAIDASTGKPVSSATVQLGDKSTTTSGKGEATFTSVPVGNYTLKVSKKYYKDSSLSYMVPVFGNPQKPSIKVTATGRQVTITVVNTISKAALAKASIEVGGVKAITDDKGMATLVLPANAKTMAGTISLGGYNNANVVVTITDQTDKNNFTLTPSGSIFYLSNATGTINVMKANLDGSNAQTVVKGTGNEVASSTVLLASRDWKYLALEAHRTNDAQNQLYLFNTQTNALTLMDQGDSNVYFNLVGWSNHRFAYTVFRYNVNTWQNGRQALKSYDADNAKLATIDQTTAMGTSSYDNVYEQISNPYIVGNKIYYGKFWNGADMFNLNKQSAAIMSINADGSQKTRIKEFPVTANSSIDVKVYEPQSLYFRVLINGQTTYYALENGTVKTVSINDGTFYNTNYPTYLVSPSSDKVFWQDYRDGKNTLFVGDQNAQNAKTLASLSDFSTYGWYGDNYVLLSKNGSELYVAPANQVFSATNQPLKITNYYKPQITYPGYGYGYGGL